MSIDRRGFLTGIIAACAAPVIVRTTGLLMPIKPALIVEPRGFMSLFYDEAGNLVTADGKPLPMIIDIRARSLIRRFT